MTDDAVKVLKLHLRGYIHVGAHVFAVSVLMMWGIQTLALVNGLQFDWSEVLTHLFLSLTFLAFFPGQTFWTYRLADESGNVHIIVGAWPGDAV